jgi:hypothetical protein
MTRSLLLGLLTVLCLGAPAAAASRYDPRLPFRTLTTPHFVIYYHRGEEPLVSRLRTIVEEVHTALTTRLKTTPKGRTHVVLVDQTDLANGFATPYPYDTIQMTAVPPTAGEIIGNFDDWLTLVFTHEYTHVLHLDRSEGWARIGRYVLGRSPLVLPNLYLPQWQTEGLATFEESINTGRGRIPAGDFRDIVDVAARNGRLEPLDRVNGGLIAWPAGSAHYAYGAYFHEYLARRFGEEKLADLGEATARRFPYTGSKAFQYVFGESLGDLWKDFARSRLEAVASENAPPEIAGRRLTTRGFAARGPRFLSPSTSEPQQIAYTLSDQHDFPAMYAVDVNGGAEREIATRVGGDRIAVGRDRLYFDQLEVARNTSVFSDLYELDRRSGDVRRLTRGLRITDPDLSPDGRTLICAKTTINGRDLVLIDAVAAHDGRVADIVTIASAPGVYYAAPRWSPDGRTIAAERQSADGRSEIVLVEVASRDVRVLVDRAGSRNTSPAWMPDGRAVLFASARGHDPFDIFAADLTGALRRVTTTRGGATFPDVSADGRLLAYVGYTEDGYDVFTMPLDRDRWTEVPSDDGAGRDTRAQPEAARAVESQSRRYTPFATLAPRAWFPIVEGDSLQTRVGAQTDGTDVLGRHAFVADASWWVAGERQPLLQEAARPNWSASYVYDRWVPVLFASLSETDTLYPLARQSEGRTTELLERHVSGGVLLPFAQMRRSHTLLASLNYERDTALSGTRSGEFERSAIRTGWAFSNVKEYGYSISSEQGLLTAVTSEHVRRTLGADGDADAATADVRVFVRAGLRHGVVAMRLAGGVSSGDPTVRRSFDLGGSGPQFALFSFDRDALSILRGFDSGAFSGQRLANANVEFRFPVWRIERGYGTWPVFAQTVHAAAFVDAGHAWDHGFDWRDVKTSVGGELAIDIVAGYFLPLTITAGTAQGQNGINGDARWRYYVRVGRAF